MVLIDFKSTDYNKAFVLNSFAVAGIAVVAVAVKNYMDRHYPFTSEIKKTFIAFISSFIAALIIYYAMHFITGFGGGMLASN